VVIRGTDAFVSAPSDSGPGEVHVYSLAGGSWSHVATLTAPGGPAGSRFGQDVAVSGERLLVGAPAPGSSNAAAYVVERSASAWSLVATLGPVPGAWDSQLGYGVALSGTRALVGARGTDQFLGEAYVYEGPSWSQVVTLTPSGTYPTGYFGASVALWGDTALVGEPAALSARGAVTFLHTPVYVTPQGVPLTVSAADGVLENDRPEGWSSLVTTQSTSPGHGTVALAPNGGFIYTPEPGFAGVDTFTYRAYDGFSVSAPAVVSITVTPGTANMRAPVSPYSVRRRRLIQVYGSTPMWHRAGTYPVVLDCYRLEGERWVLRKSVKMKAYRYPNGRKYGRWLTLPLRGRWRLVARHTEGGVTLYSAPRNMRVW
jgi:hypothetical protein